MRLGLAHFLFLFLSLATLLVLAWGAEIERAVYNKWHQTELERWLQDHNIPYPAAADRRDLQNLVQQHWNDVTSIDFFQNWSDNRLANFIQAKTGYQSDQDALDREGLVQKLQGLWSEGWNRLPTDKWEQSKTWLFDAWTDSQLRQFLEHHGVVKNLPPTTTREELIKQAKEHYDDIAKRVGGDTDKDNSHSYYPGDWVYSSWSDSELRDWLIEHGWIDQDDDASATATTSRDKLLKYMRTSWLYNRVLGDGKSFDRTTSSAASVISSATSSYKNAAEASSAAASREAAKDARILSSKSQRESLSLSSSASKAAAEASRVIASLESQTMDSWSVKQLRQWAHENNLSLPNDIKQNELQAMVRKHRDRLSKDAVSAAAMATQSLASAYGAATSSAGNGFVEATHAAASYLRGAAERLKDAFGGASSSVQEGAQKASSSAYEGAQKVSSSAHEAVQTATAKAEL